MRARRWIAAGAIILASTTAYSACGAAPDLTGQPCADGKGTWLTDESETLKSGYTVVVKICVDDGGNIIDLEVD